MNLGNQREATRADTRNTVEAVDEMKLPRRTAKIHRPRHDLRNLLAQLRPCAGTGQGVRPDVEAEIKFRFRHPVMAIRVESRWHQPPAEPGDSSDSPPDTVDKLR